MAREVAVDVASHSPQVDPILDELTDVLADLEPTQAGRSRTTRRRCGTRATGRFDRRLLGRQPAAHGPVRGGRAGGAQGRLPRLRRAGPASAAHPRRASRTRAASTCRSRRWRRCAASRSLPQRVARLRRRRAQRRARPSTSPPMYPGGRLVDAPLPTWTHRELMLTPRRPGHQPHGASVQAVHPLLGAHVHLLRGARAPRVAGRSRHRRAPVARRPPDPQRAPRFPAPPTARWRWPPRAPPSARRPRSATSASSRRCCSTTRRRRPRARRSPRPASSTSRWTPTQDGERVRRASARPARRRDAGHATAAAHDIAALRGGAPVPHSTAPSCARRSTASGIQYGPAFAGLAAAHTAEGDGHHGARRGRAAGADPLAAGRLRQSPGPARRVLPVGRRASRRAGRRPAAGCCCRSACAGCAAISPTRNAHYCLARVTGVAARRVRGRPRRAGPVRRRCC